jgi:hypothetical protein
VIAEQPKVIHLSPVPIIYWRRFAELIGLDEEVVRGMCSKGYLPLYKVGKYRFINLAALSNRCLTASDEE